MYYCQNWRGDVSVVIEDDAEMVEWVKYSSYGIPFGLPLGDIDSDGDLGFPDVTVIGNWGENPYDVRADLDLDGDIDATDATLASNARPITLGWGNLSDRGNRKGYAGYELDPVRVQNPAHLPVVACHQSEAVASGSVVLACPRRQLPGTTAS